MIMDAISKITVIFAKGETSFIVSTKLRFFLLSKSMILALLPLVIYRIARTTKALIKM